MRTEKTGEDFTDKNIKTFTEWMNSLGDLLWDWEREVERDEAVREMDNQISFMEKWDYRLKTQLEMIPAQDESAMSKVTDEKVYDLQPVYDFERMTLDVALLAGRIWGGDNFIFLDLIYQFKIKQSPQVTRHLFQKCILLIASNLDNINYSINEELISKSLKPKPSKGPNHDRDEFMYKLAKKRTLWKEIMIQANKRFSEILGGESAVQKAVERFIDKWELPPLLSRKKQS